MLTVTVTVSVTFRNVSNGFGYQITCNKMSFEQFNTIRLFVSACVTHFYVMLGTSALCKNMKGYRCVSCAHYNKHTYSLGITCLGAILESRLPRYIYSTAYKGTHGLTYFPQVRIYASLNWVNIGSDKGLPPGRRQGIIWANVGILSIEPLRTN